jgi:hypothetical protein
MRRALQCPSREEQPADAGAPGLETEVAALLAAARSYHEGVDQVAAMKQMQQLADHGSPTIRFEAAKWILETLGPNKSGGT